MDGYIRITLVLNSNKQHKKWIDYATAKGFSNLSQMIRNAVERTIKGESKSSKNTTEPIQNALNGIYQLIELTNQQVELMSMRLTKKEENSEITKVANEILSFLLDGEKPLSQIHGKLNYDREVICAALVLLVDLGLIGSQRCKSNIQDNKGEIK